MGVFGLSPRGRKRQANNENKTKYTTYLILIHYPVPLCCMSLPCVRYVNTTHTLKIPRNEKQDICFPINKNIYFKDLSVSGLDAVVPSAVH